MKCEGEKIGIGKAEALRISTEMLRESEPAAKISKYSGGCRQKKLKESEQI
jgi:hypothetical protein